MKRFFFLLAFSAITFLKAQTPIAYSSSEILQALKKLNTVGSVLYIAAHPDDENTRLLAYLSSEKNLRTGYLSLTRGDGGQNLIGKEQGEVLGLIRTQELLAARRVDGAEQFFTRANDFGFSKNPEETLKIWNKDSILADVVWCIRRFKPDVIICRFPTTGEGGHGHHTASAMLALEAFDAAADPKRYPQQLVHTEVWQARRIFWNTFNFGGNNTTSPDQLKVDVGAYNVLLGKSYGEIAADSRSMHKSQGFGSPKTRGSNIEYFKQLNGDSAKTGLFEGIDQSWNRIENGGYNLHQIIEDCINRYEPGKPENAVPGLIAIYKKLQELNESNAYTRTWKIQKLKETENLLLACSGLWMEAVATDYIGIPGNKVDITAQIICRNRIPVKLNKLTWMGNDTLPALILKQNELQTFRHKETLPATQAYSNPYWLNEEQDVGMFKVKNRQLIGQPENPPAATVVFDIELSGLNLRCVRGITYKYTDPVKGEVYRPFEVLPPATVNISEKVYVFTGAPKKVQFKVKANLSNVSGTINVKVPAGWAVAVENAEFMLENKGEEAFVYATVTPGSSNEGKLTAAITIDGVTYSKSITRVDYDHIPYQFILDDAEAGLVNMKLEKTGINIGYIPGAGDDVVACLRQVGYNVTLLTDELLTNSDLSGYNAIVTGVRAYNTNERLFVHYTKLMEYVKTGGNLIVQYNTNSRVGPLNTKVGPYPFTISRDRVTNENAEVGILNPSHPLLNYPNKITKQDFEGWKQERGIYFATDLDKNYETLLTMHDPGEKAHEGSLIVAKYGKGNFIYTGLVFFRELPAGVPGAYRLFVNMLSMPVQDGK